MALLSPPEPDEAVLIFMLGLLTRRYEPLTPTSGNRPSTASRVAETASAIFARLNLSCLLFARLSCIASLRESCFVCWEYILAVEAIIKKSKNTRPLVIIGLHSFLMPKRRGKKGEVK